MTWLYVQLTNSPLSMVHSTPLDPRLTFSVSSFRCKLLIQILLISNYVLDINTGPSDDWAMGGAGIPYAYTIELRDSGAFGFELPAE
jgi:hypothetical protein